MRLADGNITAVPRSVDREAGANPARTRHCDRGSPPQASSTAQPLDRTRAGKAREVGPGARRPPSDRKAEQPSWKGVAPHEAPSSRPACRPVLVSSSLAAPAAPPPGPSPSASRARRARCSRSPVTTDVRRAASPRRHGRARATARAGGGALERRHAAATGAAQPFATTGVVERDPRESYPFSDGAASGTFRVNNAPSPPAALRLRARARRRGPASTRPTAIRLDADAAAARPARRSAAPADRRARRAPSTVDGDRRSTAPGRRPRRAGRRARRSPAADVDGDRRTLDGSAAITPRQGGRGRRDARPTALRVVRDRRRRRLLRDRRPGGVRRRRSAAPPTRPRPAATDPRASRAAALRAGKAPRELRGDRRRRPSGLRAVKLAPHPLAAAGAAGSTRRAAGALPQLRCGRRVRFAVGDRADVALPAARSGSAGPLRARRGRDRQGRQPRQLARGRNRVVFTSDEAGARSSLAGARRPRAAPPARRRST